MFYGDYRILVTGARMWRWPQVIERELLAVVRDIPGIGIVVVHGQCDPRTPEGKIVPWEDAANWTGTPLYGADWHAHCIARKHGWKSEGHPADWERYGRSAGHRRNKEMVDEGANVCLGFPWGASPGTKGCLKLAVDADIPIRTPLRKVAVEELPAR